MFGSETQRFPRAAAIPRPGFIGVNNTADDPGLKPIISDLSETIAIVERNEFMRDCLSRCLASHWPIRIEVYASLSELIEIQTTPRSVLVVLSVISLNQEETQAELALLKDLGESARTMVLSRTDDFQKASTAFRQKANGFISLSARFEFFVQALRFVGAGGTYFPAQCLLMAQPEPLVTPEKVTANCVTAREMSVIQGIRQGKSNKLIAYELNMCESTVKVHVRSIMNKLNARNRTDVAVKGTDLLSAASLIETDARSLSPFQT